MKALKISQIARILLFYGITRHLPDSTVPCGAIFRTALYHSCRRLLQRCGGDVDIEQGAYIGCARDISVVDHSRIGIRAWIGRGTTIGSRVMMGPEVMIFTSNHRTTRLDVPMSEQGMTEDMPVTIGDDVWIGARAILLPGITINSGSIVGAGAVVTKDVPPGSIVAGNPARVVRYRIAADPKDVEWQSR